MIRSGRKRGRVALAGVVLLLSAFFIVRAVRRPSGDREWVPAQRVLPRVVVRGDVVEIRNVRDFVHRSETDFDVRTIDRTYDLSKLDSVWYVVSRFGGVPGMAHSFLSFGFGDEYVAISVEARKEADESYSPLRGLLREYELMYVVGTERDLIGVRTHVWKEGVSLYPVTTSREKMRQLFVDMVTRAEKLVQKPESYDTLTNSCSSNIVRHVNSLAPGRIKLRLGNVLPGWSDRVAYEAGLLDSSVPFERLQTACRLDASTHRLPLDDHYSAAIRRKLPRPY